MPFYQATEIQYAIGVFKTLIKHESKIENKISNQGRITSLMNKQALVILEKNLLYKTTQSQQYNFIGSNKKIYIIDSKEKKCTCIYFMDKAICKHLVASCIADGVFLKGIIKKPLRMRTIRRRNLLKQSSLVSRGST